MIDGNDFKCCLIFKCYITVIMLMTGSSFLLTPQSGEKLIINGFAIIGSFMFLIYFANTLPFHSSEVPIIGKQQLGTNYLRAVVVVQLVERSLPTTKIRGSNPDTSNFIFYQMYH